MMRITAATLLLTALLLGQQVDSFSTSHNSLFRQTKPSTFNENTLQFPSVVERRRNEIPAIVTKPNTRLSMAATAPVGAIAGLLTGGVLGGALHAIAGKFRETACLTAIFCETTYRPST